LAPLIPIFTCSQHRVRNAHPNIANFHTPYLAMGSMLTPRENVAMLCDINALELELRTCYRVNRFSHRFLWHRNINIISSPRRINDTEMYDTETCDTGMYDSVSCKWRQRRSLLCTDRSLLFRHNILCEVFDQSPSNSVTNMGCDPR
jgi:hypothetical protein